MPATLSPPRRRVVTASGYDIRVEQRWTARWRLAGQEGTLVGPTTEGVIPDFEVRQLQSVRNR